jgi:hypothetical protein
VQEGVKVWLMAVAGRVEHAYQTGGRTIAGSGLVVDMRRVSGGGRQLVDGVYSHNMMFTQLGLNCLLATGAGAWGQGVPCEREGVGCVPPRWIQLPLVQAGWVPESSM